MNWIFWQTLQSNWKHCKHCNNGKHSDRNTNALGFVLQLAKYSLNIWWANEITNRRSFTIFSMTNDWTTILFQKLESTRLGSASISIKCGVESVSSFIAFTFHSTASSHRCSYFSSFLINIYNLFISVVAISPKVRYVR